MTKNKKTKKKEQNSDDKDKITELKKEIEDLTNTLQRLQAEFDNYRKRTEIEKQDLIKTACKDAVVELLPVLDNFELALKHTSNKKEFLQGIELVYAQIMDTLERKGLKPIKALGERFNPRLHEALMQEKSKKESGVIIEELQKGYIMNDKVIRHSKVKVAK